MNYVVIKFYFLIKCSNELRLLYNTVEVGRLFKDSRSLLQENDSPSRFKLHVLKPKQSYY